MAHDCLADGRAISASIKRENQTQAFPVNNFITEMCSTLQQLLSCPQLRAWYTSRPWFNSSHLSPLPVSVCGVAAPVTAEALIATSVPCGFTTLDSRGRALWGLEGQWDSPVPAEGVKAGVWVDGVSGSCHHDGINCEGTSYVTMGGLGLKWTPSACKSY